MCIWGENSHFLAGHKPTPTFGLIRVFILVLNTYLTHSEKHLGFAYLFTLILLHIFRQLKITWKIIIVFIQFSTDEGKRPRFKVILNTLSSPRSAYWRMVRHYFRCHGFSGQSPGKPPSLESGFGRWADLGVQACWLASLDFSQYKVRSLY